MYKENQRNKPEDLHMRKMSKAMEKNKLTVIKRLLWEFNLFDKFLCTDENHNKNKNLLIL